MVQSTSAAVLSLLLVHRSILQANAAANNESKVLLSIPVLTAAADIILLGKKFDGEISLQAAGLY